MFNFVPCSIRADSTCFSKTPFSVGLICSSQFKALFCMQFPPICYQSQAFVLIPIDEVERRLEQTRKDGRTYYRKLESGVYKYLVAARFFHIHNQLNLLHVEDGTLLNLETQLRTNNAFVFLLLLLLKPSFMYRQGRDVERLKSLLSN